MAGILAILAATLLFCTALLELVVRLFDPQLAIHWQYSPDTFYAPISAPVHRPMGRLRHSERPQLLGDVRCRTLGRPPRGVRVALLGDSQLE